MCWVHWWWLCSIGGIESWVVGGEGISGRQGRGANRVRKIIVVLRHRYRYRRYSGYGLGLLDLAAEHLLVAPRSARLLLASCLQFVVVADHLLELGYYMRRDLVPE